MVVAEIRYGGREYFRRYDGWATNIVFSLVTAIGQCVGYEQVKEREKWRVHHEKLWKGVQEGKGMMQLLQFAKT